jgi:hypothetical protein
VDKVRERDEDREPEENSAALIECRQTKGHRPRGAKVLSGATFAQDVFPQGGMNTQRHADMSKASLSIFNVRPIVVSIWSPLGDLLSYTFPSKLVSLRLSALFCDLVGFCKAVQMGIQRASIEGK